ncbi:MAG: hypothetical protein ACYCTG_05470 [Ferrimicrobium sp.]
MITEQTVTRRRPIALLLVLVVYLGIPVIAERIDPIIKVSSAQHLGYALTHFDTVITNFTNGTMLSIYLINLMVIVLWLFWIWAVLSALVAIGFRLTNHTMTPKTKRWLKVASVATFLIWQSFGHSGAIAKNVSAANPVTRGTPIVQVMQNTSNTQPTTSVTVAPGQDLWGIEQAANPGATPAQIQSLVNETATVNHIQNPDTIFPGEHIQVADLNAPATPSAPEAITLDAPVVPSAPITLNAPTTGVEAPIVLDGIHVNAPSHSSSSSSASLAEGLLAMGLLAGASVLAVKRFRKRQMVKRPKGMVPVAPDPEIFDELVTLRDAEDLYTDTLAALSILTSLGAPRLDSVAVGAGELVAYLETTPNAIPDALTPYVRFDAETKTMHFARPLPEVAIDGNGLPYGGLIYLGVETSQKAHVFVNAAGRGVVGIPNANDDIWRAIYAQFAWTDWLRSNGTFFYRSRQEFELPCDQLNESQSAIAGLVDFTSDIANESELRSVVARALTEATNLQTHGTRSSLTNARMEAGVYGMDVILAKTPISETSLSHLVESIGRTDSMVMLVAQEAPEVWRLDANGLLSVPSHTGAPLNIRPASMNIATMMQHVAYLTSEAAYVSNNLSVSTLASNAQPLIQYLGDEIGLHPTLSPLANRIALVLGLRRELSLRDLALASLPGLNASNEAFTRAMDEVTSHLGSGISITNGIVRLDSSIGSDVGLLLATRSLKDVAQLFVSRALATLRDEWGFAALYGERLDALLTDHFVNIALSAARRTPDGAMAIYTLLQAVMGSTDRVELIKVAVAKAKAGNDAAMATWSEVATMRQRETHADLNSDFNPQILDELQALLGASA